jgi:hypothetical protein
VRKTARISSMPLQRKTISEISVPIRKRESKSALLATKQLRTNSRCRASRCQSISLSAKQQRASRSASVDGIEMRSKSHFRRDLRHVELGLHEQSRGRWRRRLNRHSRSPGSTGRRRHQRGHGDCRPALYLCLYQDFLCSSTACNRSLLTTAAMSSPRSSPMVTLRNVASSASCPIAS